MGGEGENEEWEESLSLTEVSLRFQASVLFEGRSALLGWGSGIEMESRRHMTDTAFDREEEAVRAILETM